MAARVGSMLRPLVLNVDDVRICSCIIPVMFTVYLCSVIVRSCLNCVTVVMVDCSSDALQPIRGSL